MYGWFFFFLAKLYPLPSCNDFTFAGVIAAYDLLLYVANLVYVGDLPSETLSSFIYVLLVKIIVHQSFMVRLCLALGWIIIIPLPNQVL